MQFTSLSCRAPRQLIGAVLVLGLVSSASAGEAERAQGPVLLTVTGEISTTNRAGFDEARDVFIKFHQRKFNKALEFDQAMLEALGMTRAQVTYSGWPKPVTVEGPLLRDVLKAAGANSAKIQILALDGFTTELSPGDLAEQDWIVALKADGRYLGIGQQGPSWILYSRKDGEPATDKDEARWPWAAFLIEVQ
jgi:hypothetical protein